MSSTTRLANPYHAWTIWFLSALFMFYKYAIEVSPSVMTSTLMQTFHINGVEFGNLAASYFYAYLLLQIPSGLLLDRFGPRKVTSLAIALCAFGTLLFARADSFWMASLGRFLTGAGAAFAAVNCLKLIANWFPAKQCAFMTGLMMTIAMLGAVGGQAPLAAFIQTMDWRYALSLIGAVGGGLALIFWMVVRDRSGDHAKEKVLTPKRISLWKSLKQVLQHSQSWWLAVYSGFAFAPVMVFGGLWGVSFVSDAFQLSPNLAAQMTSLIFIGFAVGAPFFGWFSDRIGRRKNVMSWGTLGALLFISLLLYVPHLSHYNIALFLFLFGFCISSFLLCFTMIREIHLPLLAATAIGFMNAFDALFGAFSDPLAGKLLDLWWDGTLVEGARVFSLTAYRVALLIVPLYLVVALMTLWGVKETHCKPTEPTSLP